jgi:hypothetical protein
MRITQNSIGRRFLVPSLLLMVTLTACGSGNADVTPTLGVDAIFTAAFQTLEAQQATQKALTPPTDTPSPSPFPTLPPPSPVATVAFASSTPGGGGLVCDNSAFVSDVTIPDGTTIEAGKSFTKTWRLFNSGSCAWTTGYKLAFVGGDAMGGATTVLAASVPSGSQVDISVAMTAPNANGTYKGTWRMQNDKGVSFGDSPWVEIKVGSGGTTVTPGPSPTGGPTATSGSGFTISGNAGVGSGVTVTCVGTGQKPTIQATVNNLGDYVCAVPLHWGGSIEPFKQGWNFTPQTIPVDDVLQNLSGPAYDFTATQN